MTEINMNTREIPRAAHDRDTTRERLTEMARERLADVAAWVAEHRSVVDHTVFIECCNSVAWLALRAQGALRTPSGVYGRGVLTLDLACVLIGAPMPEAMIWLPGDDESEPEPTQLPGVSAYLSERY